MSLATHHLPSPAATPSSLPVDHPPPQDHDPSSTLPNPDDSHNHESSQNDQAALRAELESQLLRLAQDLYEVEICAGDVGTGMEDAVPNYLMKINKAFVELSSLSAQMTDSVPHQIIDSVDRFKNPHYYTKQTITRATGENQFALGRVLGLESFRRQLHSALQDEFPQIPLPERRHYPAHSQPLQSSDGGIKEENNRPAHGSAHDREASVVSGRVGAGTESNVNRDVKMDVEDRPTIVDEGGDSKTNDLQVEG
ncbi:hypothetical protein IAR55_001900 [Kwoniella newhampshirensis]|uniref:Mediator of RNA polymerase II transcription subunit 10 n=1 Tax=Kwoniella newhampshirensis TaxID=1651941 RepID=A0AAW0Z3G9_9TREE